VGDLGVLAGVRGGEREAEGREDEILAGHHRAFVRGDGMAMADLSRNTQIHASDEAGPSLVR
jgi:hypothetical protein